MTDNRKWLRKPEILISETMREPIKILRENLEFTITEDWKNVSASDCNSGRQAKMAIWVAQKTSSTYISGNMTDSVEL